MRKFFICLALLMILAVPVVAYMPSASDIVFSGEALPTDDTLEVWEWTGTEWRGEDDEKYTDTARAFAHLDEPGEGFFKSGRCNRWIWPIQFTNEVQVAHWLYFKMYDNHWDWRVMKPGTFVTDCIQLEVKSNGPVNVFGDGFENLYYDDYYPEDETEDPTKTIPVWYQWSKESDDPPADFGDVSWLTPYQVNVANPWLALNGGDADPGKPFHEYLHLWNTIDVKEDDRTCNYISEAVIYLALANQKLFVDAEGNWQ